MTDWTALADRCLVAPKPDDQDNDELKAISRELSSYLMPRDDYPSVGTRANNATRLGDVRAAIELVEHLFPGWGYQVGRPLTVRTPCGWYASVFRERRAGEAFAPFAGSFAQDVGRSSGHRYANDPALALMAALCRLLAVEEPGATALSE